MLTSPHKPPGQPHRKSFLSPEKTSFHSLMDSSLLCSFPSARVSQGQSRISPGTCHQVCVWAHTHLYPKICHQHCKIKPCLPTIFFRPSALLCCFSNQSASKQKPNSLRWNQIRAFALNPPPLPHTRMLLSSSSSSSRSHLPASPPFFWKWSPANLDSHALVISSCSQCGANPVQIV